jgi:hypothetical protein
MSADIVFEKLETYLPLPIIPVRWCIGWSTKTETKCENKKVQQRLESIELARFETCQYLFSWSTLDTEQKLSAVVAMERYASELVVMCTNRFFDTPQRVRPLQFEWCFPGEPDPLYKLKSASMRSTLPAFEYACVSSCICITHAAAGILYSADIRNYQLSIDQFELCKRACERTVETLLTIVTNSAQWARLRRQGLPVQLLPSWLNLLASRMDHRAQLYSIQQVATHDESNKRNTTLVYLTRGAEDTAFRTIVAPRALLLDQRSLLKSQVKIANECYRAVVEEAHRVRVQCLLQDVEYALFSGNCGFVGIMLHDCLVSARLAFVHDVDDRKMVAVSKAVEELKQLSIIGSSIAISSDDECVQVWRAQLQRIMYYDVTQSF